MTTIAYKDGIIAYDSRCCCGSTIVSDDYNKMLKEGDVRMVFCGSFGDAATLFDLYLGRSKVYPGDTCYGVVSNKSIVSSIGYDKPDGLFYDNKEPPGTVISIGSGESYAYTAMDMGATAKEAIKWAIKRDTGTGGRIRTFKVKL